MGFTYSVFGGQSLLAAAESGAQRHVIATATITIRFHLRRTKQGAGSVSDESLACHQAQR